MCIRDSFMNVLLPFPFVNIIYNGPAMAMRMNLLLGYCESIVNEIKMIDVAQPDPGNVSFLGNSCGAVPLSFFPKIIGGFQITALKMSLIHIL